MTATVQCKYVGQPDNSWARIRDERERDKLLGSGSLVASTSGGCSRFDVLFVFADTYKEERAHF